ncbi:hypothetical protein AcV7_003240 [Taiwanofungus camphoratus]|nr:hypothetical protein AcV7_003240 [Antrodia cinnamomea]
MPLPLLSIMLRSPFTLGRVVNRSFSTSRILSSPRLSRPLPLCAPSTSSLLRAQWLVRGAASSVSGRPGSQTVRQAAQNIKEEVGNSVTDFAKVIAGANWYQDAVTPTQQTFLGITNAVAHSVPPQYIAFGLAGGLPYLGASGATIYLAHQAGLATMDLASKIDPGVAITMLDHALNFQVTYGAVLLSFLGAVHWGFEFAGYGGQKGYGRLLLGAAPVALGWSTLTLSPINALIAQWVGFTGLWWADLRATSAGWSACLLVPARRTTPDRPCPCLAPRWYSQYRFYLTLLAGTCIIGSLAATSYWGPVGGHGLVSHDLHMIRALRKDGQTEREGSVRGEVEAVPAAADGDSYVVIKKKNHPEGGGTQ